MQPGRLSEVAQPSGLAGGLGLEREDEMRGEHVGLSLGTGEGCAREEAEEVIR